jgi:hypothetical protein
MENIMAWIIFFGAALSIYVAGLFRYAFNAQEEKGPEIPSLSDFRTRMPQHRARVGDRGF